MTTEQRYVYSLDGNEFRGDAQGGGWETREQALTAGRERAAQIAALKDVDPGPVWTGIQVRCTAAAFYPEAGFVLETMSELAAGEVGGEACEEWPDVGEEAKAELETFWKETVCPFLDEWVTRHELDPTFWAVTEVVKHADDDHALAKTD
jgi:hypothetical protein